MAVNTTDRTPKGSFPKRLVLSGSVALLAVAMTTTVHAKVVINPYPQENPQELKAEDLTIPPAINPVIEVKPIKPKEPAQVIAPEKKAEKIEGKIEEPIVLEAPKPETVKVKKVETILEAPKQEETKSAKAPELTKAIKAEPEKPRKIKIESVKVIPVAPKVEEIKKTEVEEKKEEAPVEKKMLPPRKVIAYVPADAPNIPSLYTKPVEEEPEVVEAEIEVKTLATSADEKSLKTALKPEDMEILPEIAEEEKAPIKEVRVIKVETKQEPTVKVKTVAKAEPATASKNPTKQAKLEKTPEPKIQRETAQENAEFDALMDDYVVSESVLAVPDLSAPEKDEDELVVSASESYGDVFSPSKAKAKKSSAPSAPAVKESPQAYASKPTMPEIIWNDPPKEPKAEVIEAEAKPLPQATTPKAEASKAPASKEEIKIASADIKAEPEATDMPVDLKAKGLMAYKKSNDEVYVPLDEYKAEQEPSKESVRNIVVKSSPEPSAPIPTSPENTQGKVRWNAQAGTNLRDTLMVWSAEEGIDVIWNAKQDFNIPADINSRGTYEHAVGNLLDQYTGAKVRPMANLHVDPHTQKSTLIIFVGQG